MNMEQENTNYGNLFGTIDLLSEEHLEIILSTMDNDHSLFYLLFPVLGHVHNVRTLVLSRGHIPGSNVQNAVPLRTK